MKPFSKIFLVATLVGFAFLAAGSVSAEENLNDAGWLNKPLRKLGRGMTNVAFGALEIPIKIYDVNQADGGLAAISYGTLQGAAFCIVREVVGVIEVVTFPMPLPDCPDNSLDMGWGYGVILEPEFVVDQEHNLFNIVYQDTPMMN